MPKYAWKKWSSEEDNIISELWKTHTAKQLSEILPERTPDAIKRRAIHSIKIRKRDPSEVWSDSDDEKIKVFHKLVSRNELLTLFPNRSEASVRNRLYKMGLTKRDPEWEYSEMTIPLAYLLGVYLTDGHISINGYSGSMCFALSVIDRDFIDATMGAYADVCGKIYFEPRLVRREDKWAGKNNKPQWSIGLVCNDLNSWILEQTDRKRKIPNEIFSANKEQKLSFIAGMLDGDGWAGKRKNSNCSTIRYSVGFCSASEWIFDFSRILNSVGIHTGKCSKRVLPSGKDFYDLCIDKKTFVLNGGYFRISRKQNRINEYAMATLGFSPQRLSAPPPMGDDIVRASRRLEEIGRNVQSTLNA